MTNETRLSVDCPRCGSVELAMEQLWLVLPSAGTAHYDFHCPDCDIYVRHVADDEIVALLAPLVAVEELEIPAEALETHDGPALTLDDLIDLMLSLDDSAQRAADHLAA